MKSIIRPLGVSLVLGCATASWAQSTGPVIDRVDVKFVGPSSVSEDFIRSNIKLKRGASYLPGSTQDDVHSLYGTGQFYNIRVSVDQANDGGVVLTYIVQARPRVTDIKVEGNHEVSDSKLKKKITVKVGEPLDEQKLFSDVQEMKKLYEKYGLAGTKVKYVLNIEEITGHGTVTFHVEETQKVKITQVTFLGATAIPQGDLRSEIKTSRRRWYSWITGSGYFQEDDFDHDREHLVDYYHNHGYLDFEIKDTKLDHPTPNTMSVKFFVSEGRQYKLGAVKFTGEKIFSDAEIVKGLRATHAFEHSKGKIGINGLPMDVGNTFSPEGLTKDQEAVQDFYGSKGYIEISQGRALHIVRIPNVESGTIDLEFRLDESQKSYVQKIEIRGNLKTKDKVIRRELAIAPGDLLDMVRVKMSKQRLEGLGYFDKVETSPEKTDPDIPGRKDLIINVEEQNTGNFSVGAGFSTVDSVVGFAEVSQSNFDLFKPPYFTGGGQKMRVRVQLGSQRQDYEISFVEPWFLDRKLSLGVDLFRHQLNYESPNNIYDETRTGAKVSLTRALGSDFLIGSVHYTLEDVGIGLNSGWHNTLPDLSPNPSDARNVPFAILSETGDHLYQRFGGSLAYDTRNSTQLPNHGQRTEFSMELSTGDKTFYKTELTSAWYFPGFFKGHVLEAVGRTGVASSLDGGDVPFYDRYYLGGMYSLRGYKFRTVARYEAYDPMAQNVAQDPIGDDTYWFGSLEYSVPIFEKDGGVSLRFALFYDIGALGAGSYDFSGSYSDDWGLGLRLNIPHLGPLRLDYGIPITHDQYSDGSGQFQFGVGFTRQY